jgi:hypothetical protein
MAECKGELVMRCFYGIFNTPDNILRLEVALK